jgi:hypothetical protein
LFERKDAKVQRRKETPKVEVFKKSPWTVPAFWINLNNRSSSYDKIKECRKIGVYSHENPDTIFAVLEVIE